MPLFCRPEELTGKYFAVEYADDDPNLAIRETKITGEECSVMPPDGLLGSGAVERVLTAILSN
jgi:hypothetical protein